MIVYVVTRGMDYEGESVQAVCATLEWAIEVVRLHLAGMEFSGPDFGSITQEDVARDSWSFAKWDTKGGHFRIEEWMVTNV